MGTKILLLAVVITASLYLWIKNCGHCKPPTLPDYDLDYWWGPKELQGKQDKSIRPFKVEFSEAMIKDLKQRLASHRPFVPPLEGVGFQYGFNTEYLPKVLDFWKDSYNFKEREKFFNTFNHFKTNIQGLDVHYIHVKPAADKNVKILPLLLVHGWPGSVREFYDIIPLLTKPRAGYDFVFEVIVPSIPGYGFSSAAVRPGFSIDQVAIVMRNLMHRIGHKQFYVQGGDWGSAVGSNLATIFPGEVLGYHSNLLNMRTTMSTIKTLLGSIYPRLVVEEHLEDRMYPLSSIYGYILEESGYFHLQATKPDTVGVALTDSPAGLAAYILEKFSTWTNSNFRELADGGLTEKFKLVDLLDNVMVYWSTNTITTSMRLYAETMSKKFTALKMDDIPTTVPTWGFKTKHEILFLPDGLLKSKYPNLLNSTVVDGGGHFAAFEMPSTMAEDVFRAVRAFKHFRLKSKKTEL